MTDLSLRAYLQARSAEPSQGVRHLAPALHPFSLRTLMQPMKRIVIHLSDLHIGLNCNDTRVPPVPEVQVSTIVNDIRSRYQSEILKPVVIITGDSVDHADHSQHVQKVRDLLQPLVDEKYILLLVPGNHDYSNSFNSDFVSPLQTVPIVAALVRLIAEVVGKGQDHTIMSGLTFSPDAMSSFQTGLGSYMSDGKYHEDWRDKGAVYDLDFILLDGQDRETKCPDWNYAPVPVPFPPFWLPPPLLNSGFFLHNGDFRLAHGYLDAATQAFFATAVDNARRSQSLPIVGIHYRVNYGIRNFRPTRQMLAIRVLSLTNEPTGGPAVLHDLFEGTIRTALRPEDELRHLLEALGTMNPFLLPLCAELMLYLNNYYGQEGDPYTDHQNYQYDDGDITFTLVDESEVIETLDRCHLLLVGHRHKPNGLLDLQQQLLNQTDADFKSAQEVQTQRSFSEIRRALGNVPEFIPHFGPLESVKDSFLNSLAQQAVSTDLGYQHDSRFCDLKERTLHYYCEAGSPVPDPNQWDNSLSDYRHWLELQINLNTGEVESFSRP